jgi:hypothetical protein
VAGFREDIDETSVIRKDQLSDHQLLKRRIK